MKVLLINNRHFYDGGTETVYFNTAELLRHAGHEVIFFSFRRDENIKCNQEQYFVEHKKGIAYLRQYFYNKDAAKQLERLILEEKPDIAHIHLLWGGLSPSILVTLKKYNVPIVHTVHEYRMVCPAYLLKDGNGHQCERCKGGKYYNCFLHRCSKGSLSESFFMTLEMYYRNWKYHPTTLIDGFIFVSNFTRRKHIEFDNRFEDVSSVVIYNCPNAIVREAVDIDTDTYSSYYLYYGRLSVEKGVFTLLNAFSYFPHLKLKVVGSGPLEEDLKSFCSEKKLNNIEFLGFKKGRELFDLVAHAKYVCVPSECYENNPMTVVEANSLGIPVIGAGIGGTAEIVKNEVTGFTFESGNVKSLLDVITKSDEIEKELYQNQKKCALEFGKENFSRESHLNKLLDFYGTFIRKVKT